MVEPVLVRMMATSLVYSQLSAVTVHGTAGGIELVPAMTAPDGLGVNGSRPGRGVIIRVPAGADTGIRVTFGGDAPTSTSWLLPAHATLAMDYSFTTRQQIKALRAGGTNVSVDVLIANNE